MVLRARRLIVYKSADPQLSWEPVPPDEVPAVLKDPDTMGGLVDGHVAELSDGFFYKVEPQVG